MDKSEVVELGFHLANKLDEAESKIKYLETKLKEAEAKNKKLVDGLKEIIDYFDGDGNDSVQIGDLIPFVENIIQGISNNTFTENTIILLTAQNKKLVEWIQNKGHLIGCAKAIRKKCNCGHDELLKPTTDTTTEK